MWMRSWVLAGLALGLGVTPRGAPRPPMSARATASLLGRMAVCANPEGLKGVKLEATESWTVAGGARPAAWETDEVEFDRGVAIELERTHNDRPLSAKAWRGQQRAAAAIERGIAAAAARGRTRMLNLHGAVWTMRRLERQFRWRGEAAGAGEAKLVFTPRAGLRSRSRLETMLRHTTGYFLVDEATGQIRGGAFRNMAPVDYGAGIVARFREFAGHFALQPAAGGWVMRELVVEVRGRELWRRIRGTETMRYRVAGAPAARAGRR
jgi:hypothetical protein